MADTNLEVSSSQQFSYVDLYKYTGKCGSLSQQERRIKFLEELKEKRHKVTDAQRDFSNVDNQQLDDEETSGKRKGGYKFKLMLSEWMVEVPDDLEDMWWVKFAPEGFRIMLMAKKACTTCYTKDGRAFTRLRTNFPGGSRAWPVNSTILDCIYNQETSTFFILDCLFWNSMSMLDSDATFRFHWLKSKFNESPELARTEKYRFVLLDFFPAQKALIQDIMFNQLEVDGHNYSYDGVVFYHKESHYVYGYTPLVGWLASYMLPEKLQIDVANDNMFRKPENYVSMEVYLKQLSRHKHKNTRQHHNNDSLMDIL